MLKNVNNMEESSDVVDKLVDLELSCKNLNTQ